MNKPRCPINGKIQYKRAHAIKAVDRTVSYEHGKIKLRIYECTYCGYWHLTSKPKK